MMREMVLSVIMIYKLKPGYLVDPTGDYGYWFTGDTLVVVHTNII